jgi:hypothetical protein
MMTLLGYGNAKRDGKRYSSEFWSGVDAFSIPGPIVFV